MKVGVLTLPLHSNYGGNLQALALMSAIRDLGHEPILIARDKNRHPAWKIPLVLAKRTLMRARGKNVSIGAGIFDRADRARIEVHSSAFIKRYIQPQTQRYTSSTELRQAALAETIDAVVVGSDQVWRPEYAPSIADYFLGFLPKEKSVRRISYAASFGSAQWTYSDADTRVCRSLAQRFDAISVREDSAVELCQSHLGVRAAHVVDPTLLIDPSNYLNIAGVKAPTLGRGVLVYVLDRAREKVQIVDAVCASLNQVAFSVNSRTEDLGAPLSERVAPPTEDWLRGFCEADFVVTDSFHACVFAIIFNKPFIVYGNRSRGLGRFESLLRMFDLESRLVTDSGGDVARIVRDPICWDKVNECMKKQRAIGLEFLAIALRGK